MSARTRFKRIGKALITPFALWTFAALLTGLFFWFIGPLIALGSFRPLESLIVRLWILLLIALAWGVINLMVQRRRASDNQALLEALRRQEEEAVAAKDKAEELIATEVKAIKTRIERATVALRRTKPWWRRWDRSDELPWLLLIGPPGSGKTTALLNAGLTIPFAVTAAPDTPTATCDAIVTDRAIFLDLAGRYTTQDTDPRLQAAVWTGVLEWLRRHRPRQPLNGVVLVVSATDLAAMPEEERQVFAQTVRRRLDETGAQLRTRVPVYLLLSKLDLVPGFRETFEALSHEEAAQVWGIPLAPLESATAVVTPQQFSAAFGNLVSRVAKRELKRLQDEADEHSRALIFAFPNQLAALEQGLTDFLEVVCGTHQFGVAPLMRGVVMTSAHQDGAPIDLLAVPMKRAFLSMEVEQAAGQTPRRTLRPRSFFLKHFFRDILVAEAGPSGLSRSALVAEQFRRRAAAILFGAMFFGALALFWFSYRESDLYLARVVAATEQAKLRLDGYGLRGRALPPFTQTLSILDALRQLSLTAEDLASGRVFQVDVVEDDAQAAYRRGLDNLLVPYVMRSLEAAITDRTVPVATRFQQLKLYLMLGGEHPLDPALLVSLTPFITNTLLTRDEALQGRESLRIHLVSLGDPAPPPSTLDTAKVREARRLIAEVTLAKIAYDLARDDIAARNLPPWRPADNMGSAGTRALALVSGASLWDGLSALYTRTGYLVTLPPVARRISNAVAADAWVLGQTGGDGLQLQQSARILAGIYDLYRADYIRVWDSLLSDLSVVPLQNPAQAAEVLSIIIGAPSPIKQILEAVAEQTGFDPALPGGALAGAASATLAANPLLSGLPAPPRDPISLHFAPMRNAVRAPEGKESQIDGVLKVVEALYRQLNHLATGGDIIELGTEPQSVLNQANDLIARLPPSLQPVFTRIRREASAVAEGRSRDRLKGIWTSTVLPYCQTLTRGKYPFDQTSSKDVTIAEFARLLAPDGAIAGFRKMYLKSFLDTTERPWRWRTARNIDMQLSDETLKRFEQADAIAGSFFEGEKPSVRFSVEFTKLDQRATSVQLDTGGTVTSYAHGPTSPVPAQWPATPESAPVTLSVTPEVEARTNAIVGEGPWGLFRVMQKGKVTVAGPLATARFMLGNRDTTLVLNAASARHPFEPGLLTNFRCPVL